MTYDETYDNGQREAVAQDGHTGLECHPLGLGVGGLREAELAPGDGGHGPGEVEEEGREAEAQGQEQGDQEQQGGQPPGLLDGHNPALQPVQLESLEVAGDVGGVGLAAEEVEAEDGEIEHAGGGEHVVSQAAQLTQQGRRVIPGEVRGTGQHRRHKLELS